MASRPLPPGRRSRSVRAAPPLHLPDVKILSDETTAAAPTSSYAEQLRASPPPSAASVVEPEHESTTKEADYEPAPVRSVKAFVSSLEKAQEPAVPIREAPAAAAGEVAALAAQGVVPDTTDTAPPTAPARLTVDKTAPPAVATIARTSKDPVQPPVQQLYVPPPAMRVEAQVPPAAHPAPIATNPAVSAVDVPALEGFHPFKALLPIHSVPDIPETVDCVFDDAALEMQKNIMKVVKKVIGKDRTKLEDFKINSRLYGNNFMDSLEYIESLVKDLGGNRALLLVPCLVSIQPDYMKRNSMLVAARNYRLRNLSKLDASLDKIEVHAPSSASASVEQTAPTIQEVPTATLIATTTVAANSADVVVQQVSNIADEQEPVVDTVLRTPTETNPAEYCLAEEPADMYVPPAEETVHEASVEAVSRPALLVSEPVAYAVSEPLAYAESEPVVYSVSEPQSAGAVLVEPTMPAEAPPSLSPAHLKSLEVKMTEPDQLEQVQESPAETTSMDEVASSTTASAATTAAEKFESAANVTTVDMTVSNEHSSVSSAPVTPSATSPVHYQPVRRKSTISLFGEEIADDDDDDEDDESEKEKDVKTIFTTPGVEVAASAPATTYTPSPEPTTAPSFFEAESLFGEVLPVAVKPATEMSASTTTPATSLLKPPSTRTGMLFGFASAGADSDSDSDSDFSD